MGESIVLTRAGLRKALQDIGFSYRDSRKLVKSILNALTTELKTKGKLQLPFGELTIKTSPPPKRRYRFGKLTTIFKRQKRVRYKHMKDKDD